MKPANFDWFLRTMLFLHTEHVLRRQERKEVKETQDEEDIGDYDSEEESGDSDIEDDN